MPSIAKLRQKESVVGLIFRTLSASILLCPPLPYSPQQGLSQDRIGGRRKGKVTETLAGIHGNTGNVWVLNQGWNGETEN